MSDIIPLTRKLLESIRKKRLLLRSQGQCFQSLIDQQKAEQKRIGDEWAARRKRQRGKK